MTLPESARLLQREVSVDWDRGTDADLSAYYDVTSYILRGALSVNFGRDQARSTAPPKAETLELGLNNQDGRFNNVAGPLAGYVNKGPTLTAYFDHTAGVTVDSLDVTLEDLDWTVDDPEHATMFDGQVTAAPQSLDTLKVVNLSAIGALRFFTRKKITVPLLENYRVDQILNYICDLLEFPSAKRIFDTGDVTILFFWMGEEIPLPKMLQLLAAEGPNSIIYTDNQGNLHFEGNQFRSNSYYSTTVQYYLSDDTDEVAPNGQNILHSLPTTLNQSPEEVYNKVTTTVANRVIATGLTQVWSYGATLTLSPTESRKIYAQLSEPVKEAATPVVTTDFLVSSGSLTSVVIDATSGTRIGITLTAGGSGAVVTGPTGQETDGLYLRAKIVEKIADVPVIATFDTSASVDRYEEREFTIPIWPEINPNQALDSVNSIARHYREPRDQLTITVHNVNPMSAVFMLQCRISDRIHIISTHQGVDDDYFIENKALQINSTGNVIMTLQCEKVIDEDAFRFGIDRFGLNVFG